MKKKDPKNTSDKVLPFNLNHSSKNKKEEMSLSSQRNDGEEDTVKKGGPHHPHPEKGERSGRRLIHADPVKTDEAAGIISPSKKGPGREELELQRLQEMEVEELLTLLRGNLEKIQTQSKRIEFYLEEIAMTKAMESMNKKLFSGEE